jgi:hypothetical protein
MVISPLPQSTRTAFCPRAMRVGIADHVQNALVDLHIGGSLTICAVAISLKILGCVDVRPPL